MRIKVLKSKAFVSKDPRLKMIISACLSTGGSISGGFVESLLTHHFLDIDPKFKTFTDIDVFLSCEGDITKLITKLQNIQGTAIRHEPVVTSTLTYPLEYKVSDCHIILGNDFLTLNLIVVNDPIKNWIDTFDFYASQAIIAGENKTHYNTELSDATYRSITTRNLSINPGYKLKSRPKLLSRIQKYLVDKDYRIRNVETLDTIFNLLLGVPESKAYLRQLEYIIGGITKHEKIIQNHCKLLYNLYDVGVVDTVSGRYVLPPRRSLII